MPFFLPNRGPGRLIIVEGIDGSGKSTQLATQRVPLGYSSVIVTARPLNQISELTTLFGTPSMVRMP